MPAYQLRVEVTPHYLPEQSAPEDGVFAFAYSVLIRNTGDIGAQVISRTWHINDAEGLHEKIKGLGVINKDSDTHQDPSDTAKTAETAKTAGNRPAQPLKQLRPQTQMVQ